MELYRKKGFFIALLLTAFSGLSACGGGGGGGASNAELTWQAGVYRDPDLYKSYCEQPRSGASEVTGEAFDDRAGSTLEENHWLRAWINDSYLWYDEVPDEDPANYSDPLEYFQLLKTDATTASGKAKDQYHFTYNTAAWEAQSQSGISVSYGLDFVLVSATVPREVVVALTEPNAQADMAGVARGDVVLSIDGVDINDNSSNGIDALNAGLYPSDIGEQHVFELQAVDNSFKTVTLTANSVVSTAVQNVQVIDTDSGPVGYFLFTTHNSPSEAQLIAAFEQLAAASITDLVIDLRYNGGGYLAIASQVSYMVAGPSATNGKVFEHLQFNDKYSNTNPITGDANDPIPFYNTSVGFSVSSGQALPHLDLPRVYVLTTNNTCSASESIINSLRGVGVEVVQIGGATCGKPYGFYATDNCGTTYFSVQFQSVNDAGFGDYADGFASEQENALGAVSLPGCLVNDDFSLALGDDNEAMLAQALSYRQFGNCAVFTKLMAKPVSGLSQKTDVIRGPWSENRILEGPVHRF